jgi:hypothetical protein
VDVNVMEGCAGVDLFNSAPAGRTITLCEPNPGGALTWVSANPHSMCQFPLLQHRARSRYARLTPSSRSSRLLRRWGLIDAWDIGGQTPNRPHCLWDLRFAARQGCPMGSASRLAGRSVLVVEDEALIALDVVQCFEHFGCRVLRARSLEEGLRLVEEPRLPSGWLALSPRSAAQGKHRPAAALPLAKQGELPGAVS